MGRKRIAKLVRKLNASGKRHFTDGTVAVDVEILRDLLEAVAVSEAKRKGKP